MGIVRVCGVQNWARLVGGRLLVVCVLGGFRKLQADGHESAGAVVIQQRGRRRLVTALISATVVENLLLGFCVFRALDVRPGLGMPVFDAAVRVRGRPWGSCRAGTPACWCAHRTANSESARKPIGELRAAGEVRGVRGDEEVEVVFDLKETAD